MPKIIFFSAAALVLSAIVFAVLPARLRNRAAPLGPLHWALICFFSAGALLHFPLYLRSFSGEMACALKALLASLHHTLRLFVLDGELDVIHLFSLSLPGWLSTGYFLLSSAVYLTAPLLTFSAVLSFFKNLSAFWVFTFHLFSETFIFSELNERSLCLAASLKESHPKCLIVFTDVYENSSEEFGEQTEAAKKLGAACFKTDIAMLRTRLHQRTNRVTLFLIGNDEDENIHQAMQLVHAYGRQKNMALYLFASGAESELLFQNLPGDGMKLRRINPFHALVNRTLYEDGCALFQSAVPESDGERQISALVFGLGQYGTEMLKGLSWYGQMAGYHLKLTAFDRRPDTLDRFAVQCPELISPPLPAGKMLDRDEYDISIHSGVEFSSRQCLELLERMERITYIFVSLGNDTQNIAAAVKLREICERLGFHPYIQAVVYDSCKADALRAASSRNGVRYDIHFAGDLRSFYSEQNILDSHLERDALLRHLQWGSEDTFWRCEFNYRSSEASVIHKAAKLYCGIAGADVPLNTRTEAERDVLRKIEHRRWCAYMRSEGYRYSGSREKSSRNDLAKLHPDLVSYDLLSEEDREKDDI